MHLASDGIGPQLPLLTQVHAWEANFFSLVRCLKEHLDPAPKPDCPPPPKVDHDSIFLWLDFVCVPQGSALRSPVLEIAAAKAAITACQGGSLVVVDEEVLVMTRAW